MSANSMASGLIAFSVLASACVTAPFDWQQVPTRATPVSFSGWAPQQGVPVSLQAKNPTTGKFEQFATINPWQVSIDTRQNTKLYAFGGAAVVPDRYWYNGAEFWYSADLQAVQGTQTLYIGEEGSGACAQAAWSNGTDAYSAGYNCGFDTSVIHLLSPLP